MAIAFSKLTSGTQGAAALSFTTASITPAANALLLIEININATSASGDPTVTGLGLTWTQVARSTQPSADRRVYFFSAQCGATPGSGTLSASWTGSEQFVASWSVTQVTGHRTTNPIAQALTASGTVSGQGTAVAPTLAAPVNSADSRSLGVSYTRGTNLSIALKSTDWTQADRNTSVGTTVLGYDTLAWDAGPFAALGAANTNIQYCSIALEIAAVQATTASGADTAHVTDNAQITQVSLTGTQTAHVTDTGQYTVLAVTGTQTAHVAESGNAVVVAVTGADTSQVADFGERAPYLFSADEHATVHDSSLPLKGFETATDGGIVAQDGQVQITQGDLGTVLDAGQLHTAVTGADQSQLSDAAAVTSVAGDTAQITDAGQLPPGATGADTAHVTDAGQISFRTNTGADTGHVTDADTGHVTDADTAHVTDTALAATSFLGEDTAVLADAGQLSGVTVAEVATVLDEANYADIGAHRFSDTERVVLDEQASITPSEHATVLDDGSVQLVTPQDTGTLTDAGALLSFLSTGDTAQLLDAGVPLEWLSAADAGSLFDTGSLYFDGETARVVDGLATLFSLVDGDDGATVVEAATLLSLLTGADSAGMSDTGRLGGIYTRRLIIIWATPTMTIELGTPLLGFLVWTTTTRVETGTALPVVIPRTATALVDTENA